MLKAVGRNVPRKEGRDKVSGASRYIDDLSFPGLLHGRTIRSTIPAGAIADIAFPLRYQGLHHRRSPRHSGPKRRRADRRRPAVPRRARRPARRGADPAAGPRTIASALLAPTCRSTIEPSAADLRSRASPLSFKAIAIEKGDVDAGVRRGRRRSSKASTAPGTRSSSTSSPTASSPCRRRRRASRCTARCSARTTCIGR